MNFNNFSNSEQAGIVGQPFGDSAIRLLIDKRERISYAMYKYEYNLCRGVDGKIHRVKSLLKLLFRDLRSAIKRDSINNPEQFQHLVDLMDSDDFEDLEMAFNIISDWLDEKQIIRIDMRRMAGHMLKQQRFE